MKTIRQIANEIGVSKQAVRDKIDKLGLQSSLRKIGNRFTIESNAEIQIKSAFSYQNDEIENDNQSETLTDLVSILKAELDIKNKQIADLSAALVAAQEQAATAHQSLLAEQALHGEAIKRIGTEEKRGLFGIFKKAKREQ